MQKSIDNPSSFRKVTVLRNNPQISSTHERTMIPLSKFSRNSDLFSSNYHAITPYM